MTPVNGESYDDLYGDSCVIECVFANTGLGGLDNIKLYNYFATATVTLPSYYFKTYPYVDACLAKSK